MFKRPYVLAIVSFLTIPAVTVLAGMLINFIDPEIAARTSNYERNYRLLSLAKSLSMLAVLLVNMGLWFLTCFFLVKSKKRSYRWLPLGLEKSLRKSSRPHPVMPVRGNLFLLMLFLLL